MVSHLPRQRFLDGLIAGVLLVPVVASRWVRNGDTYSSRWVVTALGAAAVIPLIWRRRAPLTVWAISGFATFAALAIRGSPGLLGLAPLIALYTVATISPRRVSLLAGATTLGGVTIGIAAAGRSGRMGWQAFVFPAVVVTACWLVGDNLRVRRSYVAELEAKSARADSDREAASARAASEERARIARELHDVVAHHVSVIAVQAGAARMNAEHGISPPDPVQAWEAIEGAARQALGELRRLLGILRHDDEPPSLAPQPGLDQLDQLLEDVRQTGLPVSIQVEGTPYLLPPAVDLSAYRIIQEALTNALKHGGEAPTRVVVRYGPGELGIEVTDDGRGPPPPLPVYVPAPVPATMPASVPVQAPAPPSPITGVGHGLVGMRERVSIFGGAFAAGPRPGGGFVVSVRLPISGPPP